MQKLHKFLFFIGNCPLQHLIQKKTKGRADLSPLQPHGHELVSVHGQIPDLQAGGLGQDLPGQGFQTVEVVLSCAICRSQGGRVPPLEGEQVKKGLLPQPVQPPADQTGVFLYDRIVITY